MGGIKRGFKTWDEASREATKLEQEGFLVEVRDHRESTGDFAVLYGKERKLINGEVWYR